jgi:hypothetical protein
MEFPGQNSLREMRVFFLRRAVVCCVLRAVKTPRQEEAHNSRGWRWNDKLSIIERAREKKN